MHIYEPILPLKHVHLSKSLLWRILLLLALLLAVPFLASCRHHEESITPSGAVLTLISDNLKDGTVPKAFTCDGEDKSPMLSWSVPPANAKSLVLTVVDPGVGRSGFTHWVLFNLPPNLNGLPEGVPKQGQLAHGGRQGKTDFDKVGYGGPCPPAGNPHQYEFRLYALDAMIDVPAGAPRDQVEAAMQGHVVGHGELVAKYSR